MSPMPWRRCPSFPRWSRCSPKNLNPQGTALFLQVPSAPKTLPLTRSPDPGAKSPGDATARGSESSVYCGRGRLFRVSFSRKTFRASAPDRISEIDRVCGLAGGIENNRTLPPPSVDGDQLCHRNEDSLVRQSTEILWPWIAYTDALGEGLCIEYTATAVA